MISTYPRRLRLMLLNLALAAVAVSAANAQVADISSLQGAAEQAVRREIPRSDGQVIVHAQNLDPRLRLAECDRPLSAAIAGDGQARAHTTVAVRCEGAVHWTVYLSVTIDSESSVLVANRALARDAELAAGDFDLTPRRLPGLTTDYVTRTSTLNGQRLRQAIASGQALTLDRHHAHQPDPSRPAGHPGRRRGRLPGAHERGRALGRRLAIASGCRT